jgi:hypothetical protein
MRDKIILSFPLSDSHETQNSFIGLQNLLLGALTLQGSNQLQAVQMYWEAVCHEQCLRPLAVLTFLQAANVHDTHYDQSDCLSISWELCKLLGRPLNAEWAGCVDNTGITQFSNKGVIRSGEHIRAWKSCQR